MVKNQEKVNTSMTLKPTIRVVGLTIESKAQAHSSHLMVLILENGLTILKMVKA